MELYIIYIDNKKKSQYKTFEHAYEIVKNMIILCPNSIIEIFCEDYCDYGHEETSCKIYLLTKYVDGKINKYI